MIKMIENIEENSTKFLSASQLLLNKGIGINPWDELQKSDLCLPKIGKKYFEPCGSWLEEMQLDSGLKKRKQLLEIERVERISQLATAEWLPGIQKAKVIKRSGLKWENFGIEEKTKLYLSPEEALILLEMNCLELSWNGMPLSIQQGYEALINHEYSQCTLDEYRVYSHLIKKGYKLRRFHDKLSSENKTLNTTKRIIMNPDGLWTPNTSPTGDKQSSDSNDSGVTSKSSNDQEDDVIPLTKLEKTESRKSPSDRLGIVSEETVLGHIKIIKNNDLSTPKDGSISTNHVLKWPGSRIQRNVKLLPKRNDLTSNNKNNQNLENHSLQNTAVKRKSTDSGEIFAVKKVKPEIIELSDDEIEEIPRPMTRMEILNTLPNMGKMSNGQLIAELPRSYIPHGVKPSKDIYRFDRQRLINLSNSSMQIKNDNNSLNRQQNNHFYSQRSQCQAVTAFGSNDGFSYRDIRCQRDGNSYIQQNISHNTIHDPYSGTFVQSNYVNFVMEVMGNMVRSFRQQQFQQTTFCQNPQALFPRTNFSFSQRYQPYPINYYSSPKRDQYYRRGLPSSGPSARDRGYRHNNDVYKPAMKDEPSLPSFSKHPDVSSWSELKKKWREESTITIEDEESVESVHAENDTDNNEVQVVEESVSPLISSKGGINNMSDVYERLKIIKSASDRTIRSRKVDYSFSYEVFPVNQTFRKASPGNPLCRILVVNSRKQFVMDPSKLQKLQQESKEIPVVVAFVSPSSISYMQHGAVVLPNL